MNKIYKLKFSQHSKQLIAVSELATNTVAHHSNSTHNSAQPGSSSLLKYPALKLALATALMSSVAVSATAYAHTGAQVVAGSAEIATQGLVTTITNSPNTIINWQSFNIGKSEIVQFVQQTADSSVLNRVLGNQVSQILGTLQSNGKVFLVNPNGIVFGKHASVDVAGLVAATLDIKDSDFLQGKTIFNQEKDHAIATILNQGMIKVNNDGSLALVGGNVVNTGVLEARNGSIFLLAGNTIEIADLTNPLVSYKVTAKNRAVNLGQIIGHNVTMVANKVQHGTPSSEVSTFADIVGAQDASINKARITATGEVVLFGGSEADAIQSTSQAASDVVGIRNSVVDNNATIDVSNNTQDATVDKVAVLGDTIVLNQHSRILANAEYGTAGSVMIGGVARGTGKVKLAKTTVLASGQEIQASGYFAGGNTVVWGNQARVAGTIDVSSTAGTGGMLETSAARLTVSEDFNPILTTQGQSQAGNWLLDPEDLFILNSASPNFATTKSSNGLTDNEASLGSATPYSYATSTTADKNSYILDTTLTNALDAGGQVTLESTNSTHYLDAIVGTKGRGQLVNIMKNNAAILEVNNSTINVQSWNFAKDPTKFDQANTLHGSYEIKNQSHITVRDNFRVFSVGSNNHFNVSDSTLKIGGDFSNFLPNHDAKKGTDTLSDVSTFSYNFNKANITLDPSLHTKVDTNDAGTLGATTHSFNITLTETAPPDPTVFYDKPPVKVGTINFSDSNLTADAGKVAIVAKSLQVITSNISSVNDTAMTAGIEIDYLSSTATTPTEPTFKGSTITANSIKIQSDNGTVAQDSVFTAKAASGTGIEIIDTPLISGLFGDEVTCNTDSVTTIVDSKISSQTGVRVFAHSITSNNTKIQATTGAVFLGELAHVGESAATLIAKDVTMTGGSITSGQAVNITATDKVVIKTGDSGTTAPTISADAIYIKSSGNGYSDHDVKFKVSVTDAQLQATHDINVSSCGTMVFSRNNLQSSSLATKPEAPQDGGIVVYARDGISEFQTNTLKAKDDILINSADSLNQDVNLMFDNTVIASSDGNVTITATVITSNNNHVASITLDNPQITTGKDKTLKLIGTDAINIRNMTANHGDIGTLKVGLPLNGKDPQYATPAFGAINIYNSDLDLEALRFSDKTIAKEINITDTTFRLREAASADPNSGFTPIAENYDHEEDGTFKLANSTIITDHTSYNITSEKLIGYRYEISNSTLQQEASAASDTPQEVIIHGPLNMTDSHIISANPVNITGANYNIHHRKVFLQNSSVTVLDTAKHADVKIASGVDARDSLELDSVMISTPGAVEARSSQLKVHNHSDITAGSGTLKLAGGSEFTVTDTNLTTTIFPNAAIKSEPADVVLHGANGRDHIILTNNNINALGNLNVTSTSGIIDIKGGTTRIGKKLITKSDVIKTEGFKPTAIDPNKKLDSIAMNATNDILFIDSNLDTINEAAISTLGHINNSKIKTIGSSITSEKGTVDIGTRTLLVEKSTIGGDTTKIKSIDGSRYSDSTVTGNKLLTIENTQGAMYSDHTTMKTNGILSSTAETMHISNGSDFSGVDSTKLIATGRKEPPNPKVEDPSNPATGEDTIPYGPGNLHYGPGNPDYEQNNDPEYFGPRSEQNTGNVVVEDSKVSSTRGPVEVVAEKGTTNVDGTTISGQNVLVHSEVGTTVDHSRLEGNSKVQVTSESDSHTSVQNTHIAANKLINLFGENLNVIKNNLVVDPGTLKLSANSKLTALLNNGHFKQLIIESLNDPDSVVNRTNSWNPPIVNVNVNFDYDYEDNFTQHRIVARDYAQDLSYQEIISGNNHVVVQDVSGPTRHQTVYDVNEDGISKAYATTASSHPIDTHATSLLPYTSTATQVTPTSSQHQAANIVHTTTLATCYQDILNLARMYHLSLEQITDPNVFDKYPRLKQALVHMDDCYNDYLSPQNFNFEREEVITTIIPQ